MSRVVTLPPQADLLPDGTRLGGWWHAAEETGRIICDVCPRGCSLKPGDRGFCFVRENRDGQMVLSTYGRSTGFCIDPIEKKPLNHFYPGTSVLSFGTAGCNLGCKFCQNWDISKSREVERLSEYATPEMIAAAAQQLDCLSVAWSFWLRNCRREFKRRSTTRSRKRACAMVRARLNSRSPAGLTR